MRTMNLVEKLPQPQNTEIFLTGDWLLVLIQYQMDSAKKLYRL